MLNVYRLLIVILAIACLVLFTIVLQNSTQEGQLPIFIGALVLSASSLVLCLAKLKKLVIQRAKTK